MDQNENNELIFVFSEDEKGYSFEYSIETALSKANGELDAIDTKLEETITSIKHLTPECDKLDYALAISSGVLCGVIDIFLVSKPGESPLGDITDKWFANRTEQFAKLCGWDGMVNEKLTVPDALHSAIEFLEQKYKIPYDQVHSGEAIAKILKLTPKNNHFK